MLSAGLFGARRAVHVVSSGSRAGYESFVADPERAEHRGLLGDPPWSQRVLEVVEVQDA